MKLDDFLRVKQARCVVGYDGHLTSGKTYPVLGLSVPNNLVKVENDNGFITEYDFGRFEPVIDQVENPLQNMKLTPEFETEASESKFKVGDKVYFSTDKEIYTISEIDSENSGLAYLSQNDDDWDTNAILKFCCHATPENHEMLCKLYPHIKFEAPPKPLTGSDLARAMLDKGWVSVPCYISDESDYEADNNAFCALIGKFDRCFKELATNYEHEYAVPFDPRTGEPLTEAVLDE